MSDYSSYEWEDPDGDDDVDYYHDYHDYDYEDWDMYECPPLTLRSLIGSWLHRIRKRLYHWRKEDVSDIPF